MEITSFTALVGALAPYRGGRYVFRGHTDPVFELLPKIGRHSRLAQAERLVYEQFGREVVGCVVSPPESSWELLALGQHHGLPTRLLDWTENPLCAAFFATTEAYDRDGVVYVLSCPAVEKEQKISPVEFRGVARYRPRHITARIRAQRGLFTIHGSPTEPLRNRANGIKLHKIVIAAGCKEQLAWDLSRFGVTRASLFPDADGLAGHLSWVFRNYDPGKAPKKPTVWDA